MATAHEEIALTSSQIATMVLLLSSTETDRNLGAIHYLDQYANESDENCENLFQNAVLEPVLLHLLSPNRFIRRFALRIVAKMFAVSTARAEIECKSRILDDVRCNYTDHEDDVLNESAAVIIKEMCQSEVHWKAIAVDDKFHAHLFRRIATTIDPDVLYQSIELLGCILRHPDGLKAMGSPSNATLFPFNFMVATATQNEYPCVQISALQCLCSLAAYQGEPYESLYSDPAFVEQIFGVLENFVWFDLHDDAIRLLRQTLLRNVELVNSFLSSSLTRFMDYLDATPHHQLAAIGVLTQLAEHADARATLFGVRFTDCLLDSLKTTSAEETVQGIAIMALFEPALLEFVEAGVVGTMFERLGMPDDEVVPSDKCSIAHCLCTMFELHLRTCEQALDCEGLSIVADLLVHRCTSTEVRRAMVLILNTLAKRRLLKERVMSGNVAKGLYYTFRKADKQDEFTVDLLGCLVQYTSEQALRDELLCMNSCKHLIECLQLSVDNSLPLLEKFVSDWLLVCCKYSELCDMFIDQHVLDYLITGATEIATRPSWWSTAIEAVLDNNLPVKFAMRGHLNLDNRTLDGFYATQKIWRNYARLRQIVVNSCESRRPIYMCSFNGQPADQQLIDYLRVVSESLAIDRVPPADGALLYRAADIRRCVQHIADVVCLKLCGRTHSCPEEHLAELKRTAYHRNVIPLGALRTGGFMEKALLFKVLADRIGLPCVLHMDATDNRLVWTEVALPVYDEVDGGGVSDAFDDCGDIQRVTPLEAPTHVVDLMEEPGKLYLIDSAMAKRYLTIPVVIPVDDSIHCV